MDASSLSLDANPLLLDRIEDALSELRCWQELRDVSAKHLEWNGSPRASLRLFQANSALGCPEPAAQALAYTISRLEPEPDTELLAIAARAAENSEQWAALAKLRALQWTLKPESAGLRLKWLEALRRAVESSGDGQVVELAWRQRDRDPQVIGRVANWLARAERWRELADLLALEAAASPNPGRVLVRCMEAMHRAGTLRPDAQPVREALSLARASPGVRQVLLRKASEWRCDWLTSEILTQLTGSDPNILGFIRTHLRWLKERGQAAEAADFLDRTAGMAGLGAEQSRSLRRLLLREGRFDTVEQSLRRALQATPDDAGLMLEMAELAEARASEKEAIDWVARACSSLMEPAPGAARREDRSRVAVKWISGAADSWIARLVKSPAAECPPPKLMPAIEHLAAMTQRRGRFALWSGYDSSDVKSEDRMRAPNEVRIAHRLGVFIAHLARQLRPRLIVEVGTAFGVSGMYWASALEELGAGSLVTFEPNAAWREIAARNIGAISRRATLVDGTFEEQVAAANIAAGSIDILSLDAIHTPEAVAGQLGVAAPLLGSKAVVLIDDIRFSPEMYEYWRTIAASPGVEAGLEIESRVGLVAGYSPKVRTTR